MNSKKDINKDIMMLILGFSFMVFLIIFVKTAGGNRELNSNHPKKDKNDVVDKLDTESNNYIDIYDKLEGDYDFIYNININDQIIDINGSKVDDTVTLTIGDETIIRNITEFDKIKDYFKYFNIAHLKKVISSSNLKNNEGNVYEYYLDTFDLIDFFNGDIEYDSFQNLDFNYMKVTLEDKYISKINIDMSNYYKYIDNDNFKLIVNIEYKYK